MLKGSAKVKELGRNALQDYLQLIRIIMDRWERILQEIV